MATDKRGLSAVYLQEQLKINRYETAFNMLHKLRAAMVNPDRTPLRGVVEVDEFYVGGPEAGRPGRGAKDKAIVVVAVEVREGRPSRARFRVIPRIARVPLYGFIGETIELGSTVVTDGNPVYDTLTVSGYPRKMLSTAYGDDPDAVLPHLHTAVSNLKTWLMGTHHGAVSKKHLQAYLNEFAFRYNRRGNLQAAFQTILGLSSRVEGPTYEGLYTGTFEHKNPKLTATS
jgi:transposase-like protein